MNDRLRLTSLGILGLLLLGYFIAGKGFAYLNVSGIYIGEMVAVLTFGLTLVSGDFRFSRPTVAIWLFGLLNVWCLSRTLPYIDDHGVDALRDAVLYGYSYFALLIAASAADARTIATIVDTYRSVVRAAVCVLPVVIILTPREVNDGPPPLVMLKNGDLMVHLAGILSFHLLGLGGAGRPAGAASLRLLDAVFWTCWIGAAMWTAQSRSAIVALLSSLSVLFAFGYGRRLMLAVAPPCLVILAVLTVFDVRLDLGRREISADQFLANLGSIVGVQPQDWRVGGIDYGDLEGTADWRLRWWGDIVGYTLLGDEFWLGKGFGVNLADSDGYQTDTEEHRLRSPHSAHMTFLARAGVPGLVLWVSALAAFALALLIQSRRMQRLGMSDWSRLNIWILSYSAAFVVNGSFDVYLEGPQGGIWFWSIIGFGLAVVAVEKQVTLPVPDTNAVPPVRDG